MIKEIKKAYACSPNKPQKNYKKENRDTQKAYKWADFHTPNAGQPVRKCQKNCKRHINTSYL